MRGTDCVTVVCVSMLVANTLGNAEEHTEPRGSAVRVKVENLAIVVSFCWSCEVVVQLICS